uniref:Uncharacterized protein n=1 Tax=Timema poppense TaxID=170557 RepID=A0A7R9DFP5_TIMPO|nr:unnamed protein product [Timema poppensis]
MDQHKSTSDLGSGQFYLQAGGEAHESLDCVQQFEICWSQTERGSAIEGGCDVVSSSTTWFSIPGMVHDKGYRVEMMIIYFGGQTSEKYVLNVPIPNMPCHFHSRGGAGKIILICPGTNYSCDMNIQVSVEFRGIRTLVVNFLGAVGRETSPIHSYHEPPCPRGGAGVGGDSGAKCPVELTTTDDKEDSPNGESGQLRNPIELKGDEPNVASL